MGRCPAGDTPATVLASKPDCPNMTGGDEGEMGFDASSVDVGASVRLPSIAALSFQLPAIKLPSFKMPTFKLPSVASLIPTMPELDILSGVRADMLKTFRDRMIPPSYGALGQMRAALAQIRPEWLDGAMKYAARFSELARNALQHRALVAASRVVGLGQLIRERFTFLTEGLTAAIGTLPWTTGGSAPPAGWRTILRLLKSGAKIPRQTWNFALRVLAGLRREDARHEPGPLEFEFAGTRLAAVVTAGPPSTQLQSLREPLRGGSSSGAPPASPAFGAAAA